MLEATTQLLRSTLDAAPSLVFTAVGAAITERSGVINLGLEGMMRVGAFAAAVAALATGSPYLGLGAGLLAGALLAWLHGWLCIRWRSDQVVVGIALNLVALASVTVLVESIYGGNSTPSGPGLPRLRLGFDAARVPAGRIDDVGDATVRRDDEELVAVDVGIVVVLERRDTECVEHALGG